MVDRSALTPHALDAGLRLLHDWSLENGAIVRHATAPTFTTAIAWVVAIADLAEAAQHHPDIDIRWRTVTLRLSTHDVDAITALDIELAAQIDAVLDQSKIGP